VNTEQIPEKKPMALKRKLISAVAMLLVLAQSICNYLKTRDPNIDRFTYGSLQDQRNGDPKQIPQVSEWDADSL